MNWSWLVGVVCIYAAVKKASSSYLVYILRIFAWVFGFERREYILVVDIDKDDAEQEKCFCRYSFFY